ncbi:1-deoxy-D-xylulose-5-phosphate synthase [Corynebacterium pyruviciproducens ATCC BAA-1742]|uniref:1-deoxy-D-xylulose-5-phosphate synthase n=1 Tax=Corynebacterium pyruviciproducens ATCC BAA-1742 TaxID=1125779 RepID=S2Z1G7_9CORY|nr:1-deoxy-D-xylulose-5-phosphate synthase [Corynebacterium pyruviciproducens]EPD70296.1 1-deoxy-D-xylulose-5-phosphate synthase [Corynebacterium pyruviciproducens ATCC BAA-1742]MDK7213681.1 1-deoxy-D-xylulose-5-phosphate synthase [Corynebacterium pyruviciproducens]
MGLLSRITSPSDVRALPQEKLDDLAAEVRDFLVEKVSTTGGHLGPNLGVVELTIALHRVFESPKDPLIFDTSHQSYVHKILTGRADKFDTLRQKGGLSGYTDRGESEHDWTESSHASAALSYADGMAKAFALTDQIDRKVVAVVGDGALTGGMCWEALNNIAADKTRNIVIVVNDNGRSYSPTIGGFANSLADLRTQPFYDKVMEQGKSTLNSMGWVGKRTFEVMHALKEGVKYHVIPTEMFPELNMKYVGPVDGHNIQALEHAFKYAKGYTGPIIIHCVTQKGRGYAPAENKTSDLMHSTGAIDPVTGVPLAKSQRSWTDVFTEELLEAGARRDDIVAITAAMAGPTGLAKFGEKFPDRLFDVGIAEQHATTSAAGLALGGLHPVVALYSTFMNRAFDQLLMDVGLLHLPVTLVLDRSGITGSDGASHNGVWDMSIAGIVPGMRLAAPRDDVRLRKQFNEAIEYENGPTIVRFPKGALVPVIDAVDTLDGGIDVIYRSDRANRAQSILIVSIGALAGECVAAAKKLEEEGLAVDVIDPGWAIPVSPVISELATSYDMVVTVEDGVIHGGVGSMIDTVCDENGVDTPVRIIAVPQKFLRHASRSEVLTDLGMDAEGIAESIRTWSGISAEEENTTASVHFLRATGSSGAKGSIFKD